MLTVFILLVLSLALLCLGASSQAFALYVVGVGGVAVFLPLLVCMIVWHQLLVWAGAS